MNKINHLLNQMESNISHAEVINQEISKGSVAWHIEHSLLTLNGITELLIQSNPDNYKWHFNFLRMVVLTKKKIPRGRAKSPAVVQPKDNINVESLLAHLSLTRNKIKALESLTKNSYFKHPFFGNLKLNQSINFLEIHTKHHVEIIKDIINSKLQ